MASNNFFGDMFGDAFCYNSGDAYGKSMIILQQKQCTDTLDEMWRIYKSGNVKQIVEYNEQVDEIKKCGVKVLRNSEGKHKLVFK